MYMYTVSYLSHTHLSFMEKNARTLSGRSQLTVVPPSRRLVRTQSSGSLASITTPERTSRRFSSGEKLTNSHRSKSTSKIRTENNEGNAKFLDKKKSSKLLQYGVSPDRNGASKRTTLPSAWALSPGRKSLGSPIWSESPPKAVGSNGGNGGGRVGNSVNKVLNYFKQRKVSSMQEEVYHKFKILHNRLLQWRFINARADTSMARVKNAAEVFFFLMKNISNFLFEMLVGKLKYNIISSTLIFLFLNPQFALSLCFMNIFSIFSTKEIG